jgi:hypothetical protein
VTESGATLYLDTHWRVSAGARNELVLTRSEVH